MKNAAAIAMMVCSTAIVLPTCAHAIIATGESIEWVLANSDRVVVGKVVNVEKVVGPDKKDYQMTTVAIAKTIKGKDGDRATFLICHSVDARYANQWAEEGISMLFCLIENNGKRTPFPKERVEWVLRDAVVLGKSKYKHFQNGCIRVLTRDFEVITESGSILKYVEQSVNAVSGDRPTRSHTVDVPTNTAVFDALWSRSSVRLVVPVDAKLEKLGRKWCKSESPRDRRAGAQILRYFKNPTNIDTLRALLDDSSNAESVSYTYYLGQNKSEVCRKRVYFVRKAAFEALGELGVKLDRPVLEVLLEGRDEVVGRPQDWNQKELVRPLCIAETVAPIPGETK